jgi:hypothetical protein
MEQIDLSELRRVVDMKRLVRNKVTFSAIDPESVINVRKNLEELGSTDIVYYRSTFPPLFPEQRAIRKTQISEPENSNHIEILLNGVTIVRFFNGPWGFSGEFIDENVPDNSKKKIEEILATNGYYTGRMAWKHAPWLPVALLVATALFSVDLCYYLIRLFHSSHTSFAHDIVLLAVLLSGVLSGLYLCRKFLW